MSYKTHTYYHQMIWHICSTGPTYRNMHMLFRYMFFTFFSPVPVISNDGKTRVFIPFFRTANRHARTPIFHNADQRSADCMGGRNLRVLQRNLLKEGKAYGEKGSLLPSQRQAFRTDHVTQSSFKPVLISNQSIGRLSS